MVYLSYKNIRIFFYGEYISYKNDNRCIPGEMYMTAEECYGLLGENYNEILERFGNESMIRKYAIRFIHDPSFGELKDAFQKNDGERAFRAAHTLKGVCLNLGFSGLYQVSSDLTEELRDYCTDGAEELFKKVEQKYQSVISVLNKLALEN